MPCVFPILSIKLLSLLNLADDNPREVRLQNITYVAGVLVSFLAIAFLLAGLRSAGQLVGWGFQLQSAVFIAALIWLFLAMALNLFGLFEIELFDLNAGHQLTMHGGYWGSFFTGVLAVVVSSPCTAPFMGVALGFGLSQPVHILFAVFFMLGLGLGFPYLLFAIFPGWARYLPRPGPWMKWLKQIMAVPLLLTAVWLFWILTQMRGTSALIAVGVGCILVIVLASVARFRKAAVLLAALAVLGGLGVYVHGRKPPPAALHAKGPWQPYSAAYLESLKGQKVFVDMTADWCLTCKVNERLVLDDAEVQEAFKKHGVVLVMGDWTNRNPEITEFLNRYQRVGVPFYILYSPKHPDGLVLPEVLTKSKFLETLNGEFSN
jgi:thiol:disulfide interchange protein DsbD